MKTLLFASVLALTVPSAAQDAAPAPEPAPADLAKALPGLAPTERWYGVYFQGKKNIGWTRLAATAAEKGGIKIAIEALMDLGPMKLNYKASYEAGPDLAIRAFTEDAEEPDEIRKLEIRRGTDGKLVRTSESRPRAKPAEGEPAPAPERETGPCDLPAGAIPDVAAFLLLPRLDWKLGEPRSLSFIGKTGKRERVVATMTGMETVDVRGKSQATAVLKAVKTDEDGDEETTVLWMADKVAVRGGPEGAPILLVVGTAEEAKADLGGAATSPEDAAVRKAAAEFMKGFMLGKPDLVTRNLDLEALKTRWAEHQEEVGFLTTEAVAKILSDQVKARAGLMDEATANAQMEMVTGFFDVKVEGTKATVAMPGAPDPMHLEKKDGAWKVVWWAVFAQGGKRKPAGEGD
ncbi:MAG: DUF3108 domain-containing protein [Planctomycetales bacterium]|nr:DUF3108 domain-containing protein [Planctomycetales bacterium]